MSINPQQARALQALRKAMALATDSGLFEIMTDLSGPKVVPEFTAAVAKSEAFVLKSIRIEDFNVRIVAKGERYGLNDCLVHDKDEPLVEFFDAAQDHTVFGPLGQFVSRYYRSTLIESKNHDGLLLDTGAPHWQIGAEGLRAVKEFIGNVVAC